MIWGIFCWHVSGALIFLEGKQTAMQNLDKLADQVHLVILRCYPDGDGYFMDNNAPIHPARTVRNWSAEHQSDFQHISWPPHSPDLNPI